MRDSVAREALFRRLYADHFDAVLGFALRRTNRPEDAADVVAETFLILWRRLEHLPDTDSARPWLYGIARRVLANQRRGEGRRMALGERLRRQVADAMMGLADDVIHRADLSAAMSRLSARDEEVLRLHLWEGLAPREIAEVLGLPSSVIRPRLSRAKARLRGIIGNDPPAAGHCPSEPIATSGATTCPKEGIR